MHFSTDELRTTKLQRESGVTDHHTVVSWMKSLSVTYEKFTNKTTKKEALR